jgi:signal transduction histidine kinase
MDSELTDAVMWSAVDRTVVRVRRLIAQYLVAIATSVLAALANAALWPEFGSRYPLIAFFPAIVVSSWFGGFWPGALSTALSAAVAGYVWFAPRFFTGSSHQGDQVALGMFVGIGLMIAALYETLRGRTERAERAERDARQLSSELRQSQDRLATEVADLTRLHTLSMGLLRQGDLPAALHEILEASLELLHADKGCVQLHDGPDDRLRIVAQVGFTEQFLDAVQAVGSAPLVSGRGLARGERVIVTDMVNDPAAAELAPMYAGHDVAAMLSTPLFGSDGRLTGMLSAHFREPHRPSDRELRLLDLYAQQAERAVEGNRVLDAERLGRQQAEHASRLKDAFLSTVSHELRTPLTAILGWADLLKRGLITGASRDRALEAIRRNAQHQVRLLEELLDAARLNSGTLPLECTTIDLRTVVHDAWETVEPAALAKGIRGSLDLDPETATDPVYGDPDRLHQIVSNLFSNAVKCTPTGGRVHTQLRRHNGTAEIVVSDTGRGIAPEFLPFVFEPFSQADAPERGPQRGFGLGLSIVRHLVEAHGGQVHVASDGEGLGTTFTVRLPVLAHAGLAPPYFAPQRLPESAEPPRRSA